MVTLVVAEPPSSYNYQRPSNAFASSGFGSSGFGGGGGGGNEGANVDPALLEQVRQILLREESQNSVQQSPSSQYGAPPSSQYGAPPAGVARIVGIQLENTIPSIQVASFSQQSYAPASGKRKI